MSIDLKIRQMYAALGALVNEDINSVRPKLILDETRIGVEYRFNQSDEELANAASLLYTNLACLKDHLHHWLTTNGRPHGGVGDRLIADNKDVAVIHDLWNIDKHGALNDRRNRGPRSGFHPSCAISGVHCVHRLVAEKGRPWRVLRGIQKPGE
jgi:hypothetical protein